jgi:hypothetical protein
MKFNLPFKCLRLVAILTSITAEVFVNALLTFAPNSRRLNVLGNFPEESVEATYYRDLWSRTLWR